MVQGSHKLGKSRKSGGSQKRKSVKTVKKTKKGNAKVERNKAIIATTKAINRKNERIIAAKAMNAGTSFSLKDISTKGKEYGTGLILLFRQDPAECIGSNNMISLSNIRKKRSKATNGNKGQEAK